MINEKYDALLKEIARIIAVKNLEVDNLQEEINRLKKMIKKAEKKGH